MHIPPRAVRAGLAKIRTFKWFTNKKQQFTAQSAQNALSEYARELQEKFPVSKKNLESGERTDTDNRHIMMQDKYCAPLAIMAIAELAGIADNARELVYRLAMNSRKQVKTHDMMDDNRSIELSNADMKFAKQIGMENMFKIHAATYRFSRSVFSSFNVME
ncbi:MAG TPA: hypothetical protein HA254_05320 [Candidatus Diapherotrites archaeon]|uniref:Uncharacterized protein n=1 Tax=Candidatus Iainarchaeum sp. TaxID=3101447 RepID=A0A7J4J1Y2_9ARCH|nr:hypothetical protein [Candidatus Diapherotrites archaeon]